MLTLLFLTFCSKTDVATDYDKTVDFSKLKTYNYWEADKTKDELSDIDEKRILSAIDEQMTRKGYVKNDSPDFLINLVTDSKETQNISTYYSGSSYKRTWGWGSGHSDQTVSTITQGILFIDILDAKKKKLIWQGKRTGNLANTIEEKDKNAVLLASQILKTFPSKIATVK